MRSRILFIGFVAALLLTSRGHACLTQKSRYEMKKDFTDTKDFVLNW